MYNVQAFPVAPQFRVPRWLILVLIAIAVVLSASYLLAVAARIPLESGTYEVEIGDQRLAISLKAGSCQFMVDFYTKNNGLWEKFEGHWREFNPCTFNSLDKAIGAYLEKFDLTSEHWKSLYRMVMKFIKAGTPTTP